MATIYKRGRCWYVNWSQNGEQHRLSLGPISEREADDYRKAKELELSTGKRIFVASAAFEVHLERYLAWHRAEYPDSHYRVEQICTQHFGDFHGLAVAQIDSTRIERWKASRMMAVSRGSVAKELRTLSAVLSKAVTWGEIDRSPCDHVEPPKGLDSEPIHWYTRTELSMLYSRHNGNVWRLMANTGMRRTEALQLRAERVHIAEGHLDIVSTAEERTKSGKWRRVPLSDSGKSAAEALLAKYGSTGYVLPRITAESLSRNFLDNCKSLNLAGSLHSLRHTYAAHLVMAKVPLRTVQMLMGHASFSTTERYAHIGEDHLRDQAKLVNL